MNSACPVSGMLALDGGTETALSPSGPTWKDPDAQPRADRVLILDGNTRSALASTRSLGKKGVHVVVADEAKRTLSGASRYCSETFTYPSPASNLDGFLTTLKGECCRRGIGMILPMTEISTWMVLRHREEFESLRVPFVDFRTYDALTDKWRLLRLAEQLNLSIPKTHFVTDLSALREVLPALKFPVVLKPYRSMVSSQRRWIPASVQYARSVTELKEIAARYEYFRGNRFLIQECISGQGQGVFALYNQSKPVVFFGHRRLRERPLWGGVSVLSESIEPNPEAQRMARAILDYVGWHGVAMVEFKVSAEGVPYLMEVNGRFWGSLQLAIDAGVDFPWLLYQLAIGGDLPQVKPFITGVKCRWLLGDLVSLWKALISNGSGAHALPFGKVQAVRQFLNFSGKASRFEVNRWDDLRPFWLELRQYVMASGSGFLGKRLRPRT
jgi:predicted ATP-grasp superfamily ATP-dependent carboligase